MYVGPVSRREVDMATYRCTAPDCGAGFPLFTTYCSVCGHSPLVLRPDERDEHAWGSPGCRPRRRRRPSTPNLASLERQHRTPRLVPMGYPGLRLPVDTSIAVEGMPGAGKSTLACGIALAVAHGGTRVCYLGVEEGQGPTTIERFRRVRTTMAIPPPRTLSIADVATPREAQEEIDALLGGPGVVFVVIDSLTDLRPAPGFIQDLLSDERIGFLFTLHLTTAGVARGGLEPVYAVDVWIGVSALEATIRKSRWGAGSSFHVLEPCSLGGEDPSVIDFPVEEAP